MELGRGGTGARYGRRHVSTGRATFQQAALDSLTWCPLVLIILTLKLDKRSYFFVKNIQELVIFT